MTTIHEGKIVLEGGHAERAPLASLYFVDLNARWPRDVLFEFAGPACDPMDPSTQPKEKWTVFMSRCHLDEEGVEKSTRVRKMFTGGAPFKTCLKEIRRYVMHHLRYFQTVTPPHWWEEIDEPELLQVKVHNGKKSTSSTVSVEAMQRAYRSDYVAMLSYPGQRTKAHFWGQDGQEPKIRFDTLATGESGLYCEVTDPLALIGTLWTPAMIDYAKHMAGTILDGVVTHPKGPNHVALIMGLTAEESYIYQTAHGTLQYMITDVMYIRGTNVMRMKWHERRNYVEEIVKRWHDAVEDERRAALIEAAPYWEHPGLHDIREWAIKNSYPGIRLLLKNGIYVEGGRGWELVEDIPTKRFLCIIKGYEVATDSKYGPKGMIGKIVLGQYDGGALIDVGKCEPMDEKSREILSAERQRWMNLVIEVEAENQDKNTHQLKNPRFIGLRQTVRGEDATTARGEINE